MPEPLRAKALFARGFPLWELTAPEAFPLFGYLGPEDVALGQGRVKAVRWFKYDARLHPAIKHFWLDEAAGEGPRRIIRVGERRGRRARR